MLCTIASTTNNIEYRMFNMPTGTPEKTKICPLCGESFLPKSPAQRYCGKDHYQPCPVCGKPVVWNSANKNVPVCSKECKRKRMHKRNLEKYGVRHPMQLKEVQEKHKASVKAHFGVEYAMQSDEVKKKAVKTNQEKFGADWALGSKEFHEKCFDAMERKYGYRTSFESPELMAKAQETMLRNYGTDNAMKCKQIRQKAKNTNMEKYGVENPMQNAKIQQRRISTRKAHKEQINQNIRKAFQEKYGVDNCRQSPIVVAKIRNSLIKHYGVTAPFKSKEIKNKAMQTNIERFGVPWYTLTQDWKQGRQYITDVHNGSISNVNRKFARKLETYGISSIQFEKKLENKRFDIYLPESKTLIEIDPSYTHNTEGLNHFNSAIAMDYHISKTNIALENGYRCIHVFDWDDWDKVAQLLSYANKIYARDCKLVKIVDDKIASKFVKENHIQRQARGALLTLGLAYNNELVQVMSFGRSRYNKNYTYELLRLCSKQGVTVVGGASKLFKFATQQLELDSIISYCDASKFTGKVYEAIGMTLSKHTNPSIVWSKGSKRVTSNLLRQRGYDQLFNTHYGKGTDNEILMLANGWVPVPDCGQYVFTYEA